MPKRQKRPKVHKAWLERRLYKLEKRLDRLNAEALMVRKAIQLLDQQAAEKRKKIVEATNAALHDAGIKSAANIPTPKGGIENASHQGE